MLRDLSEAPLIVASTSKPTHFLDGMLRYFFATVPEMPAICCKIAGDAILSSTPTWFTTDSTTWSNV